MPRNRARRQSSRAARASPARRDTADECPAASDPRDRDRASHLRSSPTPRPRRSPDRSRAAVRRPAAAEWRPRGTRATRPLGAARCARPWTRALVRLVMAKSTKGEMDCLKSCPSRECRQTNPSQRAALHEHVTRAPSHEHRQTKRSRAPDRSATPHRSAAPQSAPRPAPRPSACRRCRARRQTSLLIHSGESFFGRSHD